MSHQTGKTNFHRLKSVKREGMFAPRRILIYNTICLNQRYVQGIVHEWPKALAKTASKNSEPLQKPHVCAFLLGWSACDFLQRFSLGPFFKAHSPKVVACSRCSHISSLLFLLDNLEWFNLAPPV